MPVDLKTNEWNSLKVQFRELVRDESLRGELEKAEICGEESRSR